MKNSNKEEFILKARQVHGWKYDYSKVYYINSREKICIICPKHGEFWQTPNSHLRGRGCNKCKYENSKLTKEEFIKRAKEIHGDKYDYTKVELCGADKKICIICPKHGEFYIEASKHINKGRTNQRGCPYCGDEKRRKNTRKNTEWFIKKSNDVHGDKYDYSKSVYKHSEEKVCIICPKHGEFWQTPNAHLAGHGCPMCGGNQLLNNDIFIERARKIHGDKYNYSKVVYNGADKKVCIICPKHGEFWQYVSGHLTGRGCPHCRQSMLEKEMRDFLEKEGIKYIAQKRAKWLNRQSLDFYLPDFNIAIECQGKQHFLSCKYFGGDERYKKTRELDLLKQKLCKEQGIKIIYYTHYEYDFFAKTIKDLETLKKEIYNEKDTNVYKDQHPL